MSKRAVIAEFRRNSRETVITALDEYQSCPIVDLRCWWQDEAGELRPGKTGISLSVRHLPALVDAMGKALAEARARGLIEETGGGQ